jgi:hemoglobin/transferrin/lactoferrin receptor protein
MSVACGRYYLFKVILISVSTLFLLDGAVAQPSTAAARQGVLAFDIPAQPLSTALTSFARQSGIRLVYPSLLAAGKSASALYGSFTARDALARLLAGSGLSYRFTGANAVTIVDPGAAPVRAQADEGGIVLDPINVTAETGAGSGYLGTPDRVYETPASVSVISREAIKSTGVRDTRSLLDLSAGVYSGEGQGSFPTVSPNIRGLQDSGRVVVSIDGARQNAQDGGRYGGSGFANFGGAFVDTAFVREIDISKNPGATAGTAGSLGGSVNFRTVGAADIIKPGRLWGMEFNGSHGTNKHKMQGSIIASTRIGEYLSLTGGYSRLQLGQYKPGENGTGGGTFGLTHRDSWSWLGKLEGDFGDVKTSLSWMRQGNDFAYTPSGSTDGWKNNFDARNDSAVADVAWNPDNPLINLKAKFWLNDSDIRETRDPRIASNITLSPETYIDKGLQSFGGILENTSSLRTALGALSLNYGAEAFRDLADKDAFSSVIAQNPLYASSYGTFSPPGRRDVASLFLNGKWEPLDWLNVSAGLRYDWYRLKGRPTFYSQNVRTETISVPCDIRSNHYTAQEYYDQVFLPGQSNQTYWGSAAGRNIYFNVIWPNTLANGCMPGTGTTTTNTIVTYPEHSPDIDRSGGALLPSVTVEFTPVEWLRPYVSYSHSFRPPTITEAFIGGALSPGDSVGTNLAPNPNLRPETARTTEIGLNVLRNGLFARNDALRIKAAAFRREIEDYIVMGYIQTPEVSAWEYNSFVNAAGITTMRGVELEGNYDAGMFWLGGAATWLKTEWPNKTETFNNGSATMTRCVQYACGTTTSGDIFAVSGNVPPEFKGTIDAGVRFFDRKVSVGARYNRVMPTQTRLLDADGNLTETSKAYSTIDLYASFKFTEYATLRLFANNVRDVNYVPASANYTAPGRTFLATVNLTLPFK